MKKETERQLQLELDSTHWCMTFYKHVVILTHIDKTAPTKQSDFKIIPCDMFCSKGQNINSSKRKTTPCKYAETIDTDR